MTRRSHARRVLRSLTAPVALATAALIVPRAATALPGAGAQPGVDGTPSAAVGGVFRVEIREKGKFVEPAMIVVDRVRGEMSVLVVMNERIAPVLLVQSEGSTVAGKIDTSMGMGALRLQVAEGRVTGAITVGKHALTIDGTRTG